MATVRNKRNFLLEDNVPDASWSKTGEYDLETNSFLAASPTDVVPARINRNSLKFMNTSAFDYYVRTTGAAAAGVGMLIPAGAFYEWEANNIPSGALSVYTPTTGAAATYYVAEG